MKLLSLTICFLFFVFNLFAQNNANNSEPIYGTFKDNRDKTNYKTVNIGNQTWFAQNLNHNPAQGKTVAYEEKSAYQEKYGLLYDYKTAMNACPKGWHLPSESEWTALFNFLGGDDAAPVVLKSTTGWEELDPELGEEPANNSTGFSALPGGYGYSFMGYSFSGLGETAYFWSSTPAPEEKAKVISLNYDSRFAFIQDEATSQFYSVRCLKD